MLTILVVSYNSAQVLTDCLGPLIDSTIYPVIIVDNASTDGSAKALSSRFTNASIKALPTNIGYGRAANIGLREIKTDYGLLLNPDLTATPGDISRLLNHACLDTSSTAIWGPASVKQDFAHQPPRTVNWISGCAMLFEMKKLRKIGYFDENIFLFFEETDLCDRALEAGYSVKFCPNVLFSHKIGQSSPHNSAIESIKSWHYGWSRCYYFNKHGYKKGKRSPMRQYIQYRLKSWTALIPTKRAKYRAQAAGAKAFISGQKAFYLNGKPQQCI